MNRAPSKEPEEEEILPLGEDSRLRGGAACGPGVRGAASSPSVGVEPKSTALPQAGQKRAASGTPLPQAGQLMIAAEYITDSFDVPIQLITQSKGVVLGSNGEVSAELTPTRKSVAREKRARESRKNSA
jgi:hypothetical protein